MSAHSSVVSEVDEGVSVSQLRITLSLPTSHSPSRILLSYITYLKFINFFDFDGVKYFLLFYDVSASQTLFHSGYSGGVLARIVQLYTHMRETEKKLKIFFNSRVLSVSRFVPAYVCAREYSFPNLSFSMYLTVSSVFLYSLVYARYSSATIPYSSSTIVLHYTTLPNS